MEPASDSAATHGLRREIVRLAGTMGVVLVGWLAGRSLIDGDVTGSTSYRVAAFTLLGVGLYASTYGIDKRDLAGDGWLVARAVTVGVLLKAGIIAGLVIACWRRPEYGALAVAVAQVDPLSVAALGGRPSMSSRASTLLSAWASFDDPITALLTIYVSANLLGASSGLGGSAPDFLLDLGYTVLLAAAAGGVAALLRRRQRQRDGMREGTVRTGEALALLAALAFAVARSLMLAAALVGLVFRPEWLSRWVRGITAIAYVVAAGALGLVLRPSTRAVEVGATLGAAAVAAHVVTALLLTYGLPRQDRIHLALGQQNGITAIILALLLEPLLPGTVGIVAVAILTVNILHVLANATYDRMLTRRPSGEEAPVAPPGRVPVGEPVSGEARSA